jgi:hypothetical protein
MNRHERRKTAKEIGGVTYVDYGHIPKHDEHFGVPVVCYVCAIPHKALGIARIEDASGTICVPLCESCFAAKERGDALMRKYLNAPDLEVSKGAAATAEQVLAMAEKQTDTEH